MISSNYIKSKVDYYNSDVPSARLSIPFLFPMLFPVEKYGRTGVVMGIRADESLTRYRAVSQRVHENYIIQPKETMPVEEAIRNKVDLTKIRKRNNPPECNKFKVDMIEHLFEALEQFLVMPTNTSVQSYFRKI